LAVPYGEFTKKNNEIIETKKYAYFLPEELNITGEINPEIRYRGIYKTILYNSSLSINEFFTQPVFTDLNIKESDIYWDEAFIMVGVSDMRGIQNPVMINWNNNGKYVNPGILSDEVIPSGFHLGVEVQGPDTYRFEFDLDINGSETLNFTTLGKQTLVSLQSGWKNPGFEGAFLPDERVIDENGFEAKWKILNLNRNYPQKWTGAKYKIEESAFGVRLILSVDQYQKTMRSIKYAIMFIALTFMVFFFFEILNKYRIHPIQYLLIGLALCVFYILLLSLSEHIGFNLAYLIGSISIITMITVYSISILKKVGRSLILSGVLSWLACWITSSFRRLATG